MNVRSVDFYGRDRLLNSLGNMLDDIRDSGQGQLLTVRGRRQVGKSRLFTHFVEQCQLPYLYSTAVKNASPEQQLAVLSEDVKTSTAPLIEAETLFSSAPNSWSEAFSRIALACRNRPSVVVLDEFPWAVETDASLEGVLQNAWDRQLSSIPVLLVLVGSDLAMMERLTEHDRPLFGRSRTMVVNPFDPAECAQALGGDRSSMDVFDNYLITGGYPRLVARAARFQHGLTFAVKQLEDETSDLVVTAKLTLDAEFPTDAQPYRVLSAIGGAEIGVSAFSQIVGALPEVGATAETATTRALKILVESKRVVSADHPVGTKLTSRLRHYRIKDPYLRFWFRFLQNQIPNIARGRADIAQNLLRRDWSVWRGKAIEPVVQEALLRLAPDLPGLAEVTEVGGWWNRINNPEVDLALSADQNKGQGRTIFSALGSIKWRESTALTRRDADSLRTAATSIPGAESSSFVGVCPAGAKSDAGFDLVLSADDLLPAWQIYS